MHFLSLPIREEIISLPLKNCIQYIYKHECPEKEHLSLLLENCIQYIYKHEYL